MGLQVREIGGLGRTPAVVGEEVAIGVDGHAAQAMSAHVLVQVFVLGAQGSAWRHAPRQARGHVGVLLGGRIAEVIPILVVRGGAVEHRARRVGGAGHVDFAVALVEPSGAGDGADLEHVLRLLGDVVEDAARLSGAIQHRCRSLQHLDAFDVREAELAGAEAGTRHVALEAAERVAARTVHEHLALREATHDGGTVGTVDHAADMPVEFFGVERADVFEQPRRQHRDRLRHVDEARRRPRGHRRCLDVVAEPALHGERLVHQQSVGQQHVEGSGAAGGHRHLAGRRREAPTGGNDRVGAWRHRGQREPPIAAARRLDGGAGQRHDGASHRLAIPFGTHGA